MYTDGLSSGYRDWYDASSKVNVRNGGRYSSMRIYNADKSVCLFKDGKVHKDGECFAYQEKTGQAVFDLHYFHIGDSSNSLYVPSGVQVHLYHDYAQKGAVDTYTGPKFYEVSAASANQYSSMKICRVGTC